MLSKVSKTYPNTPEATQKDRNGGKPSKLYEPNITLISKPDRDMVEKEQYRLISVTMNKTI